jgi:Xaa-Pro aminopeptidase
MRKASAITGEAHTALMSAVGNGLNDENAAEALFTSVCRKRG